MNVNFQEKELQGYKDPFDPFQSDYTMDVDLFDEDYDDSRSLERQFDNQLEADLFFGPDPDLDLSHYSPEERDRIVSYQAGFWDKIRNAFKKIGGTLKKGFQQAGQKLKSFAKVAGNAMKKWGAENIVKPFVDVFIFTIPHH